MVAALNDVPRLEPGGVLVELVVLALRLEIRGVLIELGVDTLVLRFE